MNPNRAILKQPKVSKLSRAQKLEKIKAQIAAGRYQIRTQELAIALYPYT